MCIEGALEKVECCVPYIAAFGMSLAAIMDVKLVIEQCRQFQLPYIVVLLPIIYSFPPELHSIMLNCYNNYIYCFSETPTVSYCLITALRKF